MGLHREISLKGLSPFETEIRRRLWWQILIMDSRSAQLSGAATDASFPPFWDTKRPLNINDSDLSPSMKELPVQYDGVTEMLFCSIRFEIGESMRKLKDYEKNGQIMNELGSIAQQDRIVDELEHRLEQRFLKNCDSLIPFHQLAIYLGRSSVCQMRLSVHHPRHYPDDGASLPQAEKEMLFSLAQQVLAYDNLASSTTALSGYLWHVTVNFPFQSFIVLLKELLTRVEGEEVGRVWMQIQQVYKHHPELVTKTRNPLYYAMGNLALKAWDKRAYMVQHNQPAYQPAPAEPTCISQLRAQRTSKGLSQGTQKVQPKGCSSTPCPSENTRADLNGSLVPNSDLYFSMDAADLDWDCWQNLLSGRADPFYEGYEQQMI